MKQNTPTRVVITGVGCVTPFGAGSDALLKGIRDGRTAFGPVRRFSAAQYGIDAASEITETEEVAAYAGTRPSRLFQAAADEALSDSGLTPDELPVRTALVLGTTLGSDEISHCMWRETQGELADFGLVARSMAECGGRAVVDRWRLRGPSLTVVTACAAGTNAIGLGCDLLQNGRADAVIVGGLDTLTELIYGGFANIGALSDSCQPFARDEDRHGTVLGENAAALVLEPADAAVARGADVYAEVLGYGLSNDAFHMTAPSAGGEGPILAMQRCLENAGIAPSEVDYVNAHGTGTSLNDPVEVAALWKVLGEQLAETPVSSLKSQIGHGLSSGGAIEAIATAFALRYQFVPPTAHLRPSLDERLDFVQGGARPRRLDVALSNSFAFGGHAASLALGKWDNSTEAGLGVAAAV